MIANKYLGLVNFLVFILVLKIKLRILNRWARVIMYNLIKKRQIITIVSLIILAIVIHFSGILDLFSIQMLKSHRQELQLFVANNYLLSVLLYILLFTLIVATTLPLAGFATIMAGLLFGVSRGIIYANIGATLGAGFSFFILRYLIFGDTVPERFQKKLDQFTKSMEHYGALYLLSMHLISVLPFFVINALAVLANVSFFTFIWTTSLGIIPISILYTYMGQRLGEIISISQILTLPVILAFASLAIIAILPVIISKFRKNS